MKGPGLHSSQLPSFKQEPGLLFVEQEAQPAYHCQATSRVLVELYVNPPPITARTTTILQRSRQRTSSISAVVGGAATTRARFVSCAKVPYHPLIPRFCQRTRAPTVSIRDQEFYIVLNKTSSQAITALTTTISLTLLYWILLILGMKAGSSPTTQPQPKQRQALAMIKRLATVVIFARRASSTAAS